MPYKKFIKRTKEGVKYCMTSLDSGKTYCYRSKEARNKGIRMHEAFKHGFKLTKI